MPSPIQKAAGALLGVLELKTLGRAPSQLSDQVVPVIESTEEYLIANQDTASSGNVAVTNPGDEIGLTVDAGQIWRVHTVGVLLVLNAADVALPVIGWIGYRPLSALSPVVPLTPLVTSPANARGVHLFSFTYGAQPWWAQPGSQYVFSLETQLTAAASGSIRLVNQFVPT